MTTTPRFATVLLALACGCAVPANGESPPPGNPEPRRDTRAGQALPDDAPVDAVLDALDALGDGLRDFTADVELTEEDASTGLTSTRIGRVWYQGQGEGDSRLRVTFEKKDDGSNIREEKIEYMLDDGWLVDRDYKKRIEVKRQVLRPGEKLNLLKLGEGPFPLPIGQDKADAHRLFDVTKLDRQEKDPERTIHLRLEPKTGSQFERKFKSIDVWVDQRTHMPRRIETLDRNEVSVRTTDLSDVQVNRGLRDADFALPAISDKEWTQHAEPYGE